MQYTVHASQWPLKLLLHSTHRVVSPRRHEQHAVLQVGLHGPDLHLVGGNLGGDLAAAEAQHRGGGALRAVRHRLAVLQGEGGQLEGLRLVGAYKARA